MISLQIIFFSPDKANDSKANIPSEIAVKAPSMEVMVKSNRKAA